MSLNLLSIAEVAAKLGVTRQQVTKYIAAGRIPTVEAGGRQFVEARHARKPKGRKPGPKTTGK